MKTHPYWWDTLDPQLAPSPRPQPPSSVDVAIVGAGYTGLSAARVLARAGATVVVLERERVGWGASSRNGGQVLAGVKLDVASRVDRYGEETRSIQPEARRTSGSPDHAFPFYERVLSARARNRRLGDLLWRVGGEG